MQRDEERKSEQLKWLQEVFTGDMPIFIKDRRSNLSEVAAMRVREDGTNDYMADVETDEDGNVISVRFDKVRHR